MRVLFATPTPPLLNKPRPHHLVRGLAERGHEVHVLTVVDPGTGHEALQEAPGFAALGEACASVTLVPSPKVDAYRRCGASLATARPLRVAYAESPDLVAAAEDLVQRVSPDVVHVDRERLAGLLRNAPVAKVLDTTDAISLYNRRLLRHGTPFERALAAVDLPKMARFEREMARGFSAVLVTAREDLEALLRRDPAMPVHLVPNGVADTFFAAERRPETERLVFVGNLFYAPNVDGVTWFVRRVLPRVRAVRPATELHVVGARPVRRVRALHGSGGVNVVGPVPDVVDHLSAATIAISPLRIGGGFPNKVAEAMAASVPVVTTTPGCAGLPGLVPGRHAMVADDPEGYAGAVVQLLADPSRQAVLGAGGRALVGGYRWDDVVDQLEEVYAKCLARRL